MNISIKKILGSVAVAGLIAVAAPVGAQALSLANPASALTAKHASEGVTTEVRWGRHRSWRRPVWRPRHHHRRRW